MHEDKTIVALDMPTLKDNLNLICIFKSIIFRINTGLAIWKGYGQAFWPKIFFLFWLRFLSKGIKIALVILYLNEHEL